MTHAHEGAAGSQGHLCGRQGHGGREACPVLAPGRCWNCGSCARSQVHQPKHAACRDDDTRRREKELKEKDADARERR